MDKIIIRDLKAECIVGVNPGERVRRQPVLINLVLSGDLRAAARSDDLRKTVDYSRLADRVLEFVRASDFLLIETLAERIAGLCLQLDRVKAVTVTVDKPQALKGRARSAAVEIIRRKQTQSISVS